MLPTKSCIPRASGSDLRKGTATPPQPLPYQGRGRREVGPRQGSRLRVALVAGALGYAGAAKQALYMAQSLHRAGVDIRVYSLSRGQFYDARLQLLGIEPVWFGDHDNPLLRLGVLGAKLAAFRPHFVQSANFFTNLYVGLGSRVCRALGIGTLRSDLTYEMEQNAGWARWLLRLPPVLLANSFAARRNAEALGVPPDRIAVLPNVIDLADFDARRAATDTRAGGESIAAVVGTLFPVKRFDRFLTALARARRLAPGLKGMIIGDGPERAALEQKAQALGLLPDAVRFMGHRRDVTALLGGADMVVISSDHEGFPNVVLEGMAACLPVVTTPAGDAGVVVEHGRSGYVVPFDDGEAMAVRMAHLARFPQLCRQLGTAARQRVERHYSFATLTDRLLDVYRGFARGQAREDLLRRLP